MAANCARNDGQDQTQIARMSISFGTDQYFMNEAYKQALLAYDNREIPVGAIVVSNKKIIARGHNQTEQLTDVTAHAEILALTSAFNYFGAKYIPDCTLYVTLEPCLMCAGAINWAQLGRLVYGAPDLQRGFLSFESPSKKILHPKTEVLSGIMEKECKEIVVNFFKELREK